jgi:hypothetical protein
MADNTIQRKRTKGQTTIYKTQKSKDPTITSISEINLTKLTKYLNHSPKFN